MLHLRKGCIFDLLAASGPAPKNDFDIAREAVKLSSGCFKDLGDDVKNDIDFVRWVLTTMTRAWDSEPLSHQLLKCAFFLPSVMMFAGKAPRNDEETLRLFVRLMFESALKMKLKVTYSILSEIQETESISFAYRFLHDARDHKECLLNFKREYPSFLIELVGRALVRVRNREDLSCLIKGSVQLLSLIDDCTSESDIVHHIMRLGKKRAEELGLFLEELL